MKKLKLTPISILLLILLVFSAITAVNGLFIDSGGGNSLGGGIALFFGVFLFAVLIIEQAIVKRYRQNMKAVWISELLIVTAIVAILLINDFEFSIG